MKIPNLIDYHSYLTEYFELCSKEWGIKLDEVNLKKS